jgi:hypothetical protein
MTMTMPNPVSNQQPNPVSNQQRWHWEQGIKYAIEGTKALLLLNGGAAVALLAFVGNLGNPVPAANALLSFGAGALLAVIVFFCAYQTELHYGNQMNKVALVFHLTTYLAFLLAIIAFVIGLVLARLAIIST